MWAIRLVGILYYKKAFFLEQMAIFQVLVIKKNLYSGKVLGQGLLVGLSMSKMNEAGIKIKIKLVYNCFLVNYLNVRVNSVSIF
jgi:hypothetical protein